MLRINSFYNILLLPLLIILTLLTSCVYDDSPESDNEIVAGDTLPTFEVILNNGLKISNDDLSETKGVIIFFNTDCKDCRRELPELQKAYEKTKEESLWIAIARAESDESIAKFWEDNEITIPYSPQPDRHIYELFSSSGIPRLYITEGTTVRLSYGPDNIPPSAVIADEITAIR